MSDLNAKKIEQYIKETQAEQAAEAAFQRFLNSNPLYRQQYEEFIAKEQQEAAPKESKPDPDGWEEVNDDWEETNASDDDWEETNDNPRYIDEGIPPYLGFCSQDEEYYRELRDLEEDK